MNNEEKNQRLKEVAEKDFERGLSIYKMFAKEQQEKRKEYFNVKSILIGFYSVIAGIILSNQNDGLCNVFIVTFLAIIVLSIITLFAELWLSIGESEKKFRQVSRDTTLLNIRNIAKKNEDKFGQYLINAQEIYNQECKILQMMLNKKPIENILKIDNGKVYYKYLLIWWCLLFLSAPLLFIAKLFGWL